MSTFKDDIGFWGTKRRTSRKRYRGLPASSRSKKEVQAFERGIIVGMKTSFERRRRFSVPKTGEASNDRRRRFSMPNGQPMTLGDLRRRSPSEYRSLMRGPTHMAHSPLHRFSAFGRHIDAKRRSIRRSRMPPHRMVSPGSPIRSRSNDAANAMRLYQGKRKTNPSYTLKDAWKDIRRRNHSRFGLPTESGVDRDLAFGASSDQFANGAERSSDLAIGEEEGYNNFGISPKVAFGRPSFGRPQLTL